MFPQTISFFEHKVVCKLGSHRIFFLPDVLIFCKSTDSTIVEASDMSQVSTYVLSKTKVKIMPKLGTRTPYKSKVSFRYLSYQVPKTSRYSQEARPRHLARPGGHDKTMTTSKTKSSGKTKINHGTKPTASYCIKTRYHVNYMIKT